MKFSLKWLGDFIDIKSFLKEPERLAEALTQSGLEVDSFEDQRACFKNVVVAQINSVEKHPRADRLTICKIFDGSKNYSIVCGAKNHRAGDKAVLAQPGAILPGGFLIKKTRIRGMESEGMLASREELGLEKKEKEKEEGIWILPAESQVGQSLSDYLGLKDVIFDVSVQPNRADCLSHKGLAREINCLFDGLSVSEEGKMAQNTIATPFDSSLSVKRSLKVEVKDIRACPRYCGRLIEGIQVKESPSWLKERLQSVGLKSINNVVDITNFVLWDRGQPLHAFDRDQIQTLTVAPSQKGEKFLALDESAWTLTGEELTIRDKDRVLALAGVIGGMDSSITAKTKSIFIESAGFAPESVRRTSRRFGMETDSSYRFARGVDLMAVKEAMDRACFLIQETAGGKISEDCYDIFPQKAKPVRISIRLKNLEDRLGYSVSSSQFEKWMKKIGCEAPANFKPEPPSHRSVSSTGKANERSFKLEPPSYRQDLKIKEDLIEEFARLEGYDKIPENLNPPASLPKKSDERFLKSQKLIHFLSGRGLYQAVNYSFSDPDYYKEFLGIDGSLKQDRAEKSLRPDQAEKSLKKDHAGESSKSAGKTFFFVKNPISRQLSLMKPLLAPDLLKNAIRSFRHNNKFGQIFELSPIFYQEGENYRQSESLGIACWGRPVSVWKSGDPPNVYFIKSVLESLFKAFRVKGWLWADREKPKTQMIENFEQGWLWADGKKPFLHPRQSLLLSFKGQTAGFLGSLHPQLAKKYKIPLDVALAEICWETLAQEAKKPLKFKAFSALPVVEKDLCFMIPLHLPVEDVRKALQKSLGSLCENIEVFDVYERPETTGERSVSFRIFLAPEDKTWTNERQRELLDQALQTVHKKFAISLKTDL